MVGCSRIAFLLVMLTLLSMGNAAASGESVFVKKFETEYFDVKKAPEGWFKEEPVSSATMALATLLDRAVSPPENEKYKRDFHEDFCRRHVPNDMELCNKLRTLKAKPPEEISHSLNNNNLASGWLADINFNILDSNPKLEIYKKYRLANPEILNLAYQVISRPDYKYNYKHLSADFSIKSLSVLYSWEALCLAKIGKHKEAAFAIEAGLRACHTYQHTTFICLLIKARAINTLCYTTDKIAESLHDRNSISYYQDVLKRNKNLISLVDIDQLILSDSLGQLIIKRNEGFPVNIPIEGSFCEYGKLCYYDPTYTKWLQKQTDFYNLELFASVIAATDKEIAALTISCYDKEAVQKELKKRDVVATFQRVWTIWNASVQYYLHTEQTLNRKLISLQGQ